MVEKIKFTNCTEKEIQIVMEPSTESFILAVGETINIELFRTSNIIHNEFEMVLEDSSLFIYENWQCDMRIYVNEELKYRTPPDMPKI